MRDLGEGLQSRVAVLTGQAAVTLGASDQGMVAGDLVNTAARLQAAAPPSTVLVGEATMRAASNAIAFEEAGEQVLETEKFDVDHGVEVCLSGREVHHFDPRGTQRA